VPSDPLWSARRPGARFTWTPTGVDGDPDLCAFVEFYVATNDTVLLTVTGPEVEARLDDPVAVYALVAAQWPDAAFSGDVPDLEALLSGPDGAVF
jgi:hypothetical protein